MTQLPFCHGTFDLVLCYHVLEHIPDDAAAMRELARVLTDDGLALVQVPFRNWTETDEDPTASPGERVARFGQADHVRWYGRDFDQRLVDAGLVGTRVQPPDVVGDAVVDLCGLNPRENVWLLGRSRGAAPVLVQPSSDLMLRSLAGMGCLARDASRARRMVAEQEAAVAELTHQLETAARRDQNSRLEAERWRVRYERLRGHPVVGMMAAASRPARRALKTLQTRRTD